MGRRDHYRKKGNKAGKVSHEFPRTFKSVGFRNWKPNEYLYTGIIGEPEDKEKKSPKTKFRSVSSRITKLIERIPVDGGYEITYPSNLPDPDEFSFDENDDVDNEVAIQLTSLYEFTLFGNHTDEIAETIYLSALVKGAFLNPTPYYFYLGEDKMFINTDSILDRYARFEGIYPILDKLMNEVKEQVINNDGLYIFSELISSKEIETKQLAGAYQNQIYVGDLGFLPEDNLFLDAITIINKLQGINRLMNTFDDTHIPAKEQQKQAEEIRSELEVLVVDEEYLKEQIVLKEGKLTASRLDERSELTSKERRTAQRIFEKPQGVDLLSELDKALEKLSVSEEIIIPEEIIKEKKIGSNFENIESVEEILDNWEPPVRKEKEESE